LSHNSQGFFPSSSAAANVMLLAVAKGKVWKNFPHFGLSDDEKTKLFSTFYP